MDTQDETTMSREEIDRRVKDTRKISEYLLNVEKRGEEAENRKSKEFIEMLRARKKQ